MNLAELRVKHPKFIYESYSLEHKNETVSLKYGFKLEPNVVFAPEVILPAGKEIDADVMNNFAFHLGMIEAISYWKAACSPELLIEAGKLSPEQTAWWHDLFIHGLGEFYYMNNIDFTQPGFLNISSKYKEKHTPVVHESKSAEGDLILVGGGKDSGVTLEVLKGKKGRKGVLVLNPIRSALENSRITGFQNPLIVNRTIDPTLLRLNSEGYLNGHTPFSAYLAFLGTYIGVLHDYKNVIVSNERSASEANILFHGVEVNHQYSKSFQFEKLFREYAKKYLSKDVQYFSFLRPLFDIQISRLFAQYTELHPSYRSCNVNQKVDSWCGKCAKCAFVYMSISPYISTQQAKEIFGNDYYFTPEIGEHVRDLVGLGKHKPFECVGTEEESKLAIALSIRKYRESKEPVPPLLLNLEKELGITTQSTIKMLEDRVNGKWNEKNFLPKEYAEILKKAIGSLKS